MTNVVQSHSLFEIDNELDDLLEQIEEQVDAEGKPPEDLLMRFREFCAAHGEKVDRIGRFVKTMEAREQFCRAEAARLGERARSTANKVDRTKSMVLFYLVSRELKRSMAGSSPYESRRTVKIPFASLTSRVCRQLTARLRHESAAFSGKRFSPACQQSWNEQ